MGYLALVILAMIVTRLFWRQLLTLLAWLAGGVLLYFALRVALMVDDRLASPAWAGAAIVGACVAVGVLWFGYTRIHNALVEADLSRQIERDKAQAQARKI